MNSLLFLPAIGTQGLCDVPDPSVFGAKRLRWPVTVVGHAGSAQIEIQHLHYPVKATIHASKFTRQNVAV